MTASSLDLLGVPFPFLVTALLIELTPGPNMTYLAILTLAEGRRAGLAAVAGAATGLLCIGALAALGLAEIISRSPATYSALRWGGVAYLIWLAYETWTGGKRDGEEFAARTGRDWFYFRRGLITNLLNPKAAVFYLSVLPLFASPHGAGLAETAALTLAYVIVATLVHAAITILASLARPLLENQARMQSVRRVFALALLGVALWMLWSTRG